MFVFAILFSRFQGRIRQAHDESSSLALYALEIDRSAAGFHRALNNRHANASPLDLPYVCRSMECLKKPFLIFCRDANALVCHAQCQIRVERSFE
jgi:hypothetical protein